MQKHWRLFSLFHAYFCRIIEILNHNSVSDGTWNGACRALKCFRRVRKNNIPLARKRQGNPIHERELEEKNWLHSGMVHAMHGGNGAIEAECMKPSGVAMNCVQKIPHFHHNLKWTRTPREEPLVSGSGSNKLKAFVFPMCKLHANLCIFVIL